MDNPELRARLAALDAELEEGDITQKGYQKRRVLLLAQYGLDESALNLQPPFRPVSQIPFSDGISYDRPDSPTVGGGYSTGAPGQVTQADSGNVSGAAGDTVMVTAAGNAPSARTSFLQSAAPVHLRSNSSGTPPGTHTRNFSSGSSIVPIASDPSPQQQYTPYNPPPPTGHEPQLATQQAEYDGYGPPPVQLAAAPPGRRMSFEPQESRSNTLYDSGNFFSDFTAQAYDPARESMQQQQQQQQRSAENTLSQPPLVMHRYSQGDGASFSPTAAIPPPMLSTTDLPPPGAVNTLMPLEPRDVPFAVYDAHNGNIPMSRFDNIAAVLRHRGRGQSKLQAYVVLDGKGKEIAACSYEKLALRAEKVAQVIREKSNLYRGDRVALVYRDVELIDFAVALLGCFIAGVVAVPINNLEDHQKLNRILTHTQAHLALTTDSNLKAFQRDLTNNKLSWPRGVEWWKTNEFGSFHPRKKEETPPLQVPDLAYIEFSRAPTGDLRGVVLSHRTIMHQMSTLSAIINSLPTSDPDTFNPTLRDKNGKPLNKKDYSETMLSYLDPRQGIGLIQSVLLAVYAGFTTTWCTQSTAVTPGLYANIITRFKPTLCLADYPALKAVAFNYQTEPHITRYYQKKLSVDFSSIKLMMIDALTVDPEFHEILADRWLKPLGNPKAREVVAPMLCLPEHGGMVIAMRDWIGGEDAMGCPLHVRFQDKEEEGSPKDTRSSFVNGFSSIISGPNVDPDAEKDKLGSELWEVLLDREALKTNDVSVLAYGKEVEKKANDANALRIGAFGYPIADATLAIVDPETSLLCSATTIGEIWVDSPSLSGGFWAMPKQTETIFHARPYRFEEGNPNPVPVEPEFLRTGLLGCIIDGKVFVLGLYEDRLRQRVEWVDAEDVEREEYRYFFVQHLVVTIMRNMSKIFDCSAFDIYVNEEHLPIILLESQAASTAPANPGGAAKQLDITLLDSLSERCMEVLLAEYQLRVYCVMITAPNTLPRVIKNGRREIGNMLCRKEFNTGTLPCVHVEFGVERAVRNLPIGIDPVGGVWSHLAAQQRQEILMMQEKQYSGVDFRDVVIDDRTSTPLNNFSSIVDLFQWRVARQAEELSYCSIDGRCREGKGVTWKKLDQKIAAVASLMKHKWKLSAGDHVVLIYTHSEDFLFALHACFCMGVIAIPIAPLDSNRLSEDIPALLHMVTDFKVKAMLVNNEVDHLLRSKPLAPQLKSSANILNVKLPPVHNSAKPPKSSTGCRDLGFMMNPNWVKPGYVVLVWTYWTPDQRRISVALGHDTIMGVCKVMKETCQMTSSRPLVGCVRSTSGIGFVTSWLMGIFVGAPTYLVSPVDFAQNPMSLFLTLSRYKIKDTYATPQMLDHAISTMPGKGFHLHELKNLMISCDQRPRSDIYQKVRLHFAASGLDRTAINTIYSHVLNPMVASRSYMCIEPIELWLDPKALRQGLVYPVDPETVENALLVQDSGMVPVSTRVAIVNPETCRLCHAGEYGEIWVDSEACAKAFYGSKDPFDLERFNGKTVDGDRRVTYVRTGDLGFLHNVSRPVGPKGEQMDMQILFVLGGIGETFEVNGMSHFPMDIEYSVERCHRNIVPGGSAVFQAGGLVVVLVEVRVKSYLASMVPVIVNAILDHHQLVVDIVAFVGKGDFPRSRLAEKQRGKILGSWVMRKMRTIAQFGIRDHHRDEDRTGGASTIAMGSRPTSIAAGSAHTQFSPAPQLQVMPGGMAYHPTIPETPTLTQENSMPSAAQGRDQPALVELSAGTQTMPSELPATEMYSNSDGTTIGAAASASGSQQPQFLQPPPKSKKRLSVASNGGSSSGSTPYDYPSEAIMQMKLDEGALNQQQQQNQGYGMAM